MNEGEVGQRLDGHAHRRRSGVPTVSILAGPPGLGGRLFERWSEARGARVAMVKAPAALAAVIEAWIDAIGTPALVASATAHAAAALGEAPEELAAALRCRSAYERGVWLDRALPDLEDPAGAACRALLLPPSEELPSSADLLSALSRRSGGASAADLVRAARGLSALLPADAAPAVLLLVDEAPHLDTGRLARDLSVLAAELPGLPLAMAAPNAVIAAVRASAPSRAWALLSEGVLEVNALSAAEIAAHLGAQGLVDVPRAAVERLASDGASPELVGLYTAAARVASPARERRDDDRARSAAERFLFERLASLPATAGLFELNGVVAGERRVEVDLLARAPRIALEIDGHYHFESPEAWRRDRRKDLWLQRHGYLVLRFLADDVVSRLEEILDTVVDCLRARRADEKGSQE